MSGSFEACEFMCRVMHRSVLHSTGVCLFVEHCVA